MDRKGKGRNAYLALACCACQPVTHRCRKDVDHSPEAAVSGFSLKAENHQRSSIKARFAIVLSKWHWRLHAAATSPPRHRNQTRRDAFAVVQSFSRACWSLGDARTNHKRGRPAAACNGRCHALIAAVICAFELRKSFRINAEIKQGN